MKITLKWLEEKCACEKGVAWFKSQKKTESIDVLKALIDDKKYDYANWLVVRVMTRPQYLAYAIFAAEQVIDIFERKYPDDKIPRKAIEAAKAVLKDDTPETRYAASASADAASAASAASAAAAYAAYAASASAAYASAAAYAYASAAYASAAAAYSDAAAASDAYASAESKMKTKILKYGLGLLESENKGDENEISID